MAEYAALFCLRTTSSRGKPVDALRVYYKANTDYTGVDAFTIDVDAKLGFVKRYAFTMDIR